MPMWKSTDVAGNSVIWAPAMFNKAPSRANANTLFGNTTGNGYITGLTVGMYGVSDGEMRAVRTGKVARPAHAGWVIKKTKGTRVMYETLVAMSSMTGDSENVSFPSYALVFTSQAAPATQTVNGSHATVNTGTLTVSAASVPAGATLTYYWQSYISSAFVNCAGNAAFSNTTNTTLVVTANALSNGTFTLRCVAATANSVVANNVASANALFVKTA